MIVAFEVENDPFRADDVCSYLQSFHVSGPGPMGLVHFVEPSTNRNIHSWLLLLDSQLADRFPEGAPGCDAHRTPVARDRIGVLLPPIDCVPILSPPISDIPSRRRMKKPNQLSEFGSVSEGGQ